MIASMQSLETMDLLYRKNPQSTRLGRGILETGTHLLTLHGLEWLTFRKLAQAMDSTEASVYRYFHNKHQLLAYLVHQYGQRFLQQLQAASPGSLDPMPELLKQIFPDPENTDPARSLLPIFWGWYAAHDPSENAYADLALAPFEDIISHVTQHLGVLGSSLSARELAYLLCGSSLLALMPGFSNHAEAYRQLWDHLLAGLVQAPENTPPLQAAVPEMILTNAVPDRQEEPEPEYEPEPKPEPEDTPVIFEVRPESSGVEETNADPPLQITHIMLRKFGGYNLLERTEFESMPLYERVNLRQGKRLEFLSQDGDPIYESTHAELVEQLFKA